MAYKQYTRTGRPTSRQCTVQSSSLTATKFTRKTWLPLQIWCSTMTDQEWVQRILSGVHSPTTFRVIGTLSNTPYFQEAFQCKPGDPMNPSKKCSVWWPTYWPCFPPSLLEPSLVYYRSSLPVVFRPSILHRCNKCGRLCWEYLNSVSFFKVIDKYFCKFMEANVYERFWLNDKVGWQFLKIVHLKQGLKIHRDPYLLNVLFLEILCPKFLSILQILCI